MHWHWKLNIGLFLDLKSGVCVYMQRTIRYLGHLLSCIYTPTSAAIYKGALSRKLIQFLQLIEMVVSGS